MVPGYLSNKFTSANAIHSYNLRDLGLSYLKNFNLQKISPL
jgi:hypothetical protein